MAPTESEMYCGVNVPSSAITFLLANKISLDFFHCCVLLNYFLLHLSLHFNTRGKMNSGCSTWWVLPICTSRFSVSQQSGIQLVYFLSLFWAVSSHHPHSSVVKRQLLDKYRLAYLSFTVLPSLSTLIAFMSRGSSSNGAWTSIDPGGCWFNVSITGLESHLKQSEHCYTQSMKIHLLFHCISVLISEALSAALKTRTDCFGLYLQSRM